LTIDVAEAERPAHTRIRYLHGSSTDPAIVEQVQSLADGAEGVMVVLDSDHARDHVFAELEAYAPLVTRCYLIAEDTNVNGRPVLSEARSRAGRGGRGIPRRRRGVRR
jgi:cephalosporin hydroxylase